MLARRPGPGVKVRLARPAAAPASLTSRIARPQPPAIKMQRRGSMHEVARLRPGTSGPASARPPRGKVTVQVINFTPLSARLRAASLLRPPRAPESLDEGSSLGAAAAVAVATAARSDGLSALVWRGGQGRCLPRSGAQPAPCPVKKGCCPTGADASMQRRAQARAEDISTVFLAAWLNPRRGPGLEVTRPGLGSPLRRRPSGAEGRIRLPAVLSRSQSHHRHDRAQTRVAFALSVGQTGR